ncbi:MAG: dihydroneopterin aldolase [Bacteroidia bacterium]|nr:dihydroneopterin aldolase [Bacteroidia bacterium]
MGSTGQVHTTRRAVGLSGVEVYGHVGYFPEERKMGRLFRVDAYLEYSVSEVGDSPPVDYREVASLIREAFSREGILIEHIAQQLADAILERWGAVDRVQIRVYKIHPPIGILAESAYAYVEMARK